MSFVRMTPVGPSSGLVGWVVPPNIFFSDAKFAADTKTLFTNTFYKIVRVPKCTTIYIFFSGEKIK